MTTTEAKEAAALLRYLLEALLGLPHDRSLHEAADFRRAVGELSAQAETRIRAAEVGLALLACFDLARQAGVTGAGFARFRTLVLAQGATSAPAVAIRQAGLRMSLVQESRILAATSFDNRDAVESAMAQMNEAFDDAEMAAADALDTGTYRALTTLHAAVVHDLATRGLQLPRVARFSFAIAMPAYAMANTLYGDAGRAGDLMRENPVPHPLFMPRDVRALSD